MSRRALLIGATPVVAAAAAAAGSLAMQYSRAVQESPVTFTPTAAPVAASPPPESTRAAAAATPGTPASVADVTTPGTPASLGNAATPAAARSRANAGAPEGMTLVASPRLPVSGVGPDAPWRLMTGDIANWSAVGSPVPLAVRPVALAGEGVSGIEPVDTFDDYAALASALARDAGAVAMIPAELVDFRVQTLTVGGEDPLRRASDDGTAFRIGIIGDIVPGRNVHLHMQRYGDFTRPFHRVAPLLQSFDVTIANLEGNLSDTLPQPVDPHSFSFVSSPAMLEGMRMAGIDALTLANNHTVWNSEDWGVQGLLDTIAALDAFGMPFFGAGQTLTAARAPWVVEVAGIRIAFLGIDGVTANYEAEPGAHNGVLDFDAGASADRPGTNPFLMWQVLEDIGAATEVADVVIPYFHFGAEYVAIPPAWAAQAARTALDAGAAMVVSNHPHVIQGMEIYAGKPIVYSPGNFILDQMWAAEVRSGHVLEVDFRGARIVGLRYHGIEIEEFHQPRLMTAGEQAALMDRFWAASDRLAARDGLES